MNRDEAVYLQHILDAIAKAESYLEGMDESAFNRSSLIQDCVIRQIEIIGEATKRLSPELRAKNAHIPWSDIAGMRDKFIHGYFGVEVGNVWLTAVEDLRACETTLRRFWQN